MTRPLQGALIGFGFIAEKGHVPAYLAAPDAFDIVAVAEICAARREKARQVLPKARKDDTKVPLSTKAWEERRKQQKAELDAASPELAKAPPRLTVTTLAGSSGPGPGPAAKADDLLVKWQDSLARDHWVDESVSILGDMK